MKSINNTINGFASSLLLNVGLTKVAEKLDPVQKQKGVSRTPAALGQSSETCIYLCNFTPEAGE